MNIQEINNILLEKLQEFSGRNMTRALEVEMKYALERAVYPESVITRCEIVPVNLPESRSEILNWYASENYHTHKLFVTITDTHSWSNKEMNIEFNIS